MHTDEQAVAPRPGAISRIVEFCAVALLVALCAMLLASSLMRHLGMGDPRLFEVTRIAFVYLIGISAVAAFLMAQNIVVPGWWRMDSAGYQAAQAVVAGALAWLSWRYVALTGFEPDTMSLLRLPEAVPYVPVLIFAASVAVISVVRAVRAL